MRPDQGEIVLIVDDDEQVRKLCRLIFKKAGYRVLMASSSQEALVVSRNYPEQIDVLFSDVEMPGMNGIALGSQITAERPGIAVLLNSANPTYAAETQFPFLAKPYTPETLQTAIARALENQPQVLGPVEFEAIRSLARESSYPPPEISTPEMERVEAGAAFGRPAGHSTTVLPESARSLPEAVVLLSGVQRNSSKMRLPTTSTQAHDLAIALRERISLWRLPHSVPVWVAAAAALVLAIVPFSLYQINGRQSAGLYKVSLQSIRGLGGEAEAPSGTPLLLNLDITSLPRSDSYEIRIANGDGHTLWGKVVPAQGSEMRTKAAGLRPGTYFVRLYEPAGELLKEYVLRVTETH